MDYNLLADDTLLQLFKSSEERAFRAIYDRYWRKLFLIAYKKIHSKEAAEEIIQDIYIYLWKKRESSNIQNVKAYLLSAVKYRVISFVKEELVKKGPMKEIVSETGDNTTDCSIVVNDLNSALQEAINLLPVKTGEVFTLSRLHHLSVREIAQKLDISEKTVEYHITQSLKLMKVYLKDFLITMIVSSIFNNLI